MSSFALTNMPLVLSEETLNCFKFLYNGELLDGLLSQNELFYRLYSTDSENRDRLYQQACRLSHQEPIVITTTRSTYSIWVSLRSNRQELYLTSLAAQKTAATPRFSASAPAIIETVAERAATALAANSLTRQQF